MSKGKNNRNSRRKDKEKGEKITVRKMIGNVMW